MDRRLPLRFRDLHLLGSVLFVFCCDQSDPQRLISLGVEKNDFLVFFSNYLGQPNVGKHVMHISIGGCQDPVSAHEFLFGKHFLFDAFQVAIIL